MRHIHLKASKLRVKTSSQKIHSKLASKPLRCVVWIVFDKDTLAFTSFYFLGSAAGRPLLGLDGAKIAKHVKANSEGIKNERPNIRTVNKGQFTKIDSLEALYQVLFFSGL